VLCVCVSTVSHCQPPAPTEHHIKHHQPHITNPTPPTHQAVELRERVKAARLIREDDDVALQQRDGDVPRGKRLAQELISFGGREREREQWGGSRAEMVGTESGV
jgi:hypothetical protein